MHATIRHQAKRAASLATITALLAASLTVFADALRPSLVRADLIPESVQRASLDLTGAQFSGPSWRAGVSADGQHVVYSHDRTGSNSDVYVWDVGSDRRSVVSVTTSGAYFGIDNGYPSSSADGRYIVFENYRVAGEPNIYLRDRDVDGNGVFDEAGGVATRVMSTAAKVGVVTPQAVPQASLYGSRFPRISSNGRFVVFVSTANLDSRTTKHAQDVYLHDRDPDDNGVFDEPGLEETSRVSPSGTTNGVPQIPSVSDDGRWIAYQATSATGRVYDRTTNTETTVGAYPVSNGAAMCTDDPELSGSGRFLAFSNSCSVAGGDARTLDPTVQNQVPADSVWLKDRDTDGDGLYDEAGAVSSRVLTIQRNAPGYPATYTTEPLQRVSSDGTVVWLCKDPALLASKPSAARYLNVCVKPRNGGISAADVVPSGVLASGGISGSYEDLRPAIADRAPVVAFKHNDANLVSGDTNGAADIFRAEMTVDVSALITSLTPASDTTGPGASVVPISAIPQESVKSLAFDVSTAPGGTKVRPRGTKVRPGGTKVRPGGTKVRDVAGTTLLSLASRLKVPASARKAPVSQIQVLRDGGWKSLLAGTPFASKPLQSVSIGALLDYMTVGSGPPSGSGLRTVTLGELVLDDSPLIAVTPAGFEAGTTPVSSLKVDDGSDTLWCTKLASVTNNVSTCAGIGVGSTVATGSLRSLMELDLDPTVSALLGKYPVLRRFRLGANLTALTTAAAPVVSARLDDLNLKVSKVGDTMLTDAITASSGVGAVLVSSLSAGEQATVVSCVSPTVFDCSTGTLAQAQTAGALVPGRKLSDVGKHFGSTTVVSLGASLLAGVSVNDVVTGYLDAADFPWEDADLDGMGVQRFASEGSTLGFSLGVRVNGASSAATASATVNLPPGFLFKQVNSFTPSTGQSIPAPVETRTASGTTLVFTLNGLVGDTDYTLQFTTWPGLQLGNFKVSASVVVGSVQGQSAPASVTVADLSGAGSTEATAKQVQSGYLYLGYLPACGGACSKDLRSLYRFTPSSPDAQVGVRMSQLAGDSDLVLYGPKDLGGSHGPRESREGVFKRRAAVQRITESGMDPAGNSTAASSEITAGVASDPSLTKVAVSTAGNGTDEEIASGRGANLIQVSPFTAAKTADLNLPYVLRVREIASTSTSVCAPYTHPYTGTPGVMPDLTALGPDLQTVFLVNRQRLGDLYPGEQVDTVMARLQTLAADPSVHGVVIPVDAANGTNGLPDVAGAYAAWDGAQCDPGLANLVSDRIGMLVDGIVAGTLPGVVPHPYVFNVVLVGSDTVVPMARISDTTRIGNENSYEGFAKNTAIGGALSTGHFLSDAPYGDVDPLPWNNRNLYLEDRAVGRLVENPTEIIGTIDQYLASGGILSPSSALVAGYDWMKTGATQVADALGSSLSTANGATVTPTRLINDTWSAATLLGSSGIGGAHPRVTSLFMHADHTQGFSATSTQATPDAFTPQGLADALPVGPQLVFSMGCHAGLNEQDTASRTMVDFPEAMAGVKGAVYVAATGYGLGNDSGAELHDGLMVSFARQLDGAVSIGDALWQAKQDYWGKMGVHGESDDKVVETMTLYGLPMYRIGPNRTVRATPGFVDPQGALGLAASASFAFDTQSASGSQVRMVAPFSDRTGSDGTTWSEVSGYEPLSIPGRPLLPQVSTDVTALRNGTLLSAHGALVTELTDRAAPASIAKPAWAQASLDAAVDSAPVVAGDLAFPARLASVTTLSDPTGAPTGDGPALRQRLVVNPALFETDGSLSADGSGTQELFKRVAGSVLYSSSDDFDEPSVTKVDSSVDPVAHTATFTVDAGDASGVWATYVLYKDAGVWKMVALTGSTSSPRWSKTVNVAAATTDVQYFVQVVDSVGNVATASNKGALSKAAFTPQARVSNVTVSEPGTGSSNASLTVRLTDSSGASAATSVPVQVSWSTADGSALAGADYTTSSGTVLFAAGETSKTITVPVLADKQTEKDETFKVKLANPVGVQVVAGSGDVATVKISGNTGVIEASITSPGRIPEGSPAVFTVSLSEAPSGTMTVGYRTVAGSGTAGSGVDYTAVSGTVSFSGSTQTRTVSVPTSLDLLVEGDETFTVELYNPSTGVTIVGGSDAATIVDSPEGTVATVNAGDALGVEGGDLVFPITLSQPASGTVTVRYQTALLSDTATAPADYTSVSGTLTFTPGQTSKTVTVHTILDSTIEDDETLSLVLSNATGAVVGTNPGTGTLQNVPVGLLAISNATAAEGSSAVFTVTLTQAPPGPVTVAYTTQSGTATSGTDFTAVSGTLTFAPGTTTQTISVPLTADQASEASESFSVKLSNATSAFITDATGAGTIIDVPVVTVADATAAEGGDLVFPVTLSRASASAVNVDWTTTDATATAGTDYTADGGTLVVPAGQTTGTIRVHTLSDTSNETTETLTVNLSNPVNGVLARTVVTGSITDVPAGSLTIGDATVIEGDDAILTVNLNQALASGVTVNYSTAAGTATAGSDFTASSGSVTFSPGQTTKTLTVPVTTDLVTDGGETFTVTITSPTGTPIARSTATVTITDIPVATVSDTTAPEGDDAVVAVDLSVPSTRTVTLDYATTAGTATAGSDYTTQSGVLTFTPGDTHRTIHIPILTDRASDDGQTFSVVVSNPVNTVIGRDTATVTITNTPVIPLAPNPPTVTQIPTGLQVTYQAPTDTGGSTITAYTIACTSPTGTPGTTTTGPQARQATLTGLTVGATYTCTVSASNAMGDSAASTASDAVTVADVPATMAAPTVEVSSTGDLVVSYPSTTDARAAAIMGYTVSCGSTDGGTSRVVSASPSVFSVTVTGLTEGRTYGCSVHASNGMGDATDSEPAAGVRVPTVPGVPVIASVASTDGGLNVSWVLPDSGGLGIVASRVDCTASDGATGSVTVPAPGVSGTVTGLVNGKTYACVVRATNGIGTGDPSDPSAGVVPARTPGTVPRIVVAADDLGVKLSWGAPLDNGGALLTGYQVTVTAADGSAAVGVTGPTTRMVAGLSTVFTALTNGLDYRFEVRAVNAGDRTSLVPVVSKPVRPRPRIHVAGGVLVEGDAGLRDLQVTVSLSSPSVLPVSVNLAALAGTATGLVDFAPVTGTITFTPGTLDAVFRVPIVGDTLVEATETFSVKATLPTNAALGAPVGVWKILNDDVLADNRVWVGDVTIREGLTGVRTARIPISLSRTTTGPVTVTWTLASIKGITGSDVDATTGTITLPAGTLITHLEIPVHGDTTTETAEKARIVITDPTGGPTIGRSTGYLTIQNGN